MNFKFEDNRVNVKNKLNDNSINLLEELAAELEAQTIRNSRTNTGQTKRAWSHVLDKNKLEATVGNPLENAIWEENGTGEYAINKDGRTGGWYIRIGNGNGQIPKEIVEKYNFKVIKGKNDIEYAYTTGKKPTRAFYKAMNTIKEKAKEIAKIELGDIK